MVLRIEYAAGALIPRAQIAGRIILGTLLQR
jgi:hypothetical protein